jgi:transposase-like protein
MSQPRYSAARKVDAVRRVVEDGRSVGDVAREFGVSEGSLFFWVRRYREFARSVRESASMLRGQGQLPRVSRERELLQVAARSTEGAGSLVACLRRSSLR